MTTLSGHVRPQVTTGPIRGSRKAYPDGPGGLAVTQLAHARAGVTTPEMRYVAIRESCDAEMVRSEVARPPAIEVDHP